MKKKTRTRMAKLFPFLTVILVLAALFLLASCEKDIREGADLSVMGRKSDVEKSYMTAIFEHYEKSTGKKLHIISVPDDEFETKAAEMFKKGEGPDILMHFNNAELQRFDIENDFMFLDGEEWVSDLTDGAKAYCLDADGNLLGLPFWESSISGCYYNKTLLDSLGLKPATTQAEFDMLCRALSDIGYTPICWAADGCTWMFQFGLDPIFADDPELLEKLNANEIGYSDIPEVEAMVRWIREAAEKGWFGQNYQKTDWNGISAAMSSGDAVMTFIWDTWFYTDFTPGKYTLEDFALMPVFMNTVDGGTYEGGNLNMMMVNKNSDRRELALEFLSFCATPENYNVAFDGISTVSSFRGQTTNIQSHMVTSAAASIAENERVSTAASKIIGYSADDMEDAFARLFRGKLDDAGCVKLMDEMRLGRAKSRSAPE